LTAPPPSPSSLFSSLSLTQAALSFLLFLLSVSFFSSATTSRLLLSPNDAGAALSLVGAAFEESSGTDASAAPGRVSAEAFRGRSGGISGAAESAAAAAAAAEPPPEGNPNLSDAAPAAETPPAETTAPPPPPPTTTTTTLTLSPPPPTPAPPSTTTSVSTSQASAATLPPLAVSADGHLTAGGTAVELRGLNWFGFEAGQTFVDGTSWSGSGSALSHDALAVLWRIKLLGFNAVRLPFSFEEFSKAPRDVTSRCDWVGDAEVARSVAPPGVELPAAALAAVPPLFASAPRGGSSNEGHGGGASDPIPAVTPAPGTQGLWEHKVTCNADVPTTSVKERLLWLTKKCVAAGLYVILDDHISYDTTILDDKAKWVASWKELAADLAREPSLAGAVMLVRNCFISKEKNRVWV